MLNKTPRFYKYANSHLQSENSLQESVPTAVCTTEKSFVWMQNYQETKVQGSAGKKTGKVPGTSKGTKPYDLE